MPEFRKLAKGVYAFLQPPLICYSSAGVIIGDRDVIVVDSLTNTAMTQSLLAENPSSDGQADPLPDQYPFPL